MFNLKPPVPKPLAEGILSREELDAELEKMGSQYGIEVEKIKNELMDDERLEELKKDIAVQKAITFVTENAKEK